MTARLQRKPSSKPTRLNQIAQSPSLREANRPQPPQPSAPPARMDRPPAGGANSTATRLNQHAARPADASSHTSGSQTGRMDRPLSRQPERTPFAPANASAGPPQTIVSTTTSSNRSATTARTPQQSTPPRADAPHNTQRATQRAKRRRRRKTARNLTRSKVNVAIGPENLGFQQQVYNHRMNPT